MGEGGFAAAWLLAEAIVIYREVQDSHHMPVPAQLIGITGFFAALALIGDISPNARRVTTLVAIGLDLAGIFSLIRGGSLGSQITQAESAEATAEGE
jgi:hypothetical protein